jgi:hypothetical protein
LPRPPRRLAPTPAAAAAQIVLGSYFAGQRLALRCAMFLGIVRRRPRSSALPLPLTAAAAAAAAERPRLSLPPAQFELRTYSSFFMGVSLILATLFTKAHGVFERDD